MTTTSRPSSKTAAVITELSSPTVLAPALLVAVALAQWPERRVASIGWGFLAALFAGVLPLCFLRLGVRRGAWTDHHVDERQARYVPLTFAIASVAVGIALLYSFDAPRDVTALIIAMMAGLVAVTAISLAWKISIHSAVAGGTMVILGLVFGWIGLVIGGALAVAAAWSRLRLDKHSIAQVVMGLAVGAIAAGAVFPVLR